MVKPAMRKSTINDWQTMAIAHAAMNDRSASFLSELDAVEETEARMLSSLA
eukprot:CAMPEP_0196793428 /NCGR_PEP_ID=MMETSP1104-20130614/32966_1 /TAXON_ID=33652 /ORGANISM="Cafeteria sp., Strain Caron Lab Isolate" /LENGTH=50 /DNA_ID=CAMNT_0042163799 /DNA_START=105 /DNA_END=257 /DNA_ORIENTATION=-